MNNLKTIKTMKTFIIIFSCLLCSFTINAQDEIQEYNIDGLKVIHKKVSKKVVNAAFVIRGGTANYDKAAEGIERFGVELAVTGGTENYPKDDFNMQLEKMGSSISGDSSYDYTKYELNCLKRSWDESWNLFADAIVSPAYPEKEFEIVKNQMVTAAQQGDADPDTKLRNEAMSNTFEGLPYAKIPQGTEASLSSMKLNQVKRHMSSVLNKANSFLVIVGDVSKADIEKKVKESLAKLPAGRAKTFEYGPIDITNSTYNATERDIATNYVRGMMNAPSPNDKDYAAMRVAMSIVYDRMFKEIRTKRNLSYAPGAYMPSSVVGQPYTIWYVSTDKPNEAVQVMFDEIKKLKLVGFSEKELKDKKAGYLTRHFMQQETSASQATTLALAEISEAGWKSSTTFLDDVNALNIDDINEAFDKYAKAIQWTYLGDPSAADESVFTQDILTKKELKQNLKAKKKRAKKRRKNKKTFSN